MGRMKELLITVYCGGDEAVAAVQRLCDDWRATLEQAANEVECLRAERQELWHTVSDMKAAAETAGYVFRNTDSGPNLVR
jgi:hypothetical protein